MIQCPACGQAIKDGDSFCALCGTPATQELTGGGAFFVPFEPPAEPPDSDTLLTEAPAEPPPAKVQPKSIQRELPDATPENKQEAFMPTASEPAHKPVEAKKTYTFVNTGLGLLLAGVLLAGTFFALYTTNYWVTVTFESFVSRFGVYALAAIAVAVSARAKGPDLSIGAVMGASAVVCAVLLNFGITVASAVVLTVLIGAAFGLINGLLTAFLRMPAVILTFLTGLIVKGALMMAGNVMPNLMSAGLTATPTLVFGLTGGVLAIAFVLVLLTKLGVPTYKRKNAGGRVSFMLAYLISAAIAAAAGLLLMTGGEAAPAALDTHTHYEFFIVFVFAVLGSSRAMDNRFVPVLLSLVPAMIWTFGTYAAELWFIQSAHTGIYGTAALIMLSLAYVFRYERRGQEEKLKKPKPLPLAQ